MRVWSMHLSEYEYNKQMRLVVMAWVKGRVGRTAVFLPQCISYRLQLSTHPPSLPSFLPPLRKERNDESRRREFKTFQRSFLAVALLAMFSDWTQGPYSYALYAYYGYECAQPALPPSLPPSLRSFSPPFLVLVTVLSWRGSFSHHCTHIDLPSFPASFPPSLRPSLPSL